MELWKSGKKKWREKGERDRREGRKGKKDSCAGLPAVVVSVEKEEEGERG